MNPETPHPTDDTINTAMRRIERLLDNEAFGDELITLAENDPNSPIAAIEDKTDLTDEQEDLLVDFQDAIFGHAFLKVAFQMSPEILNFIRKVRDYLEVHNSREALEGYMNDLATDLNPILAELDIDPITIVESRA